MFKRFCWCDFDDHKKKREAAWLNEQASAHWGVEGFGEWIRVGDDRDDHRPT